MQGALKPNNFKFRNKISNGFGFDATSIIVIMYVYNNKIKKKKKKGLCGQKKLHSSSLGGLKMPSNHHDDSLLPH